jgi:hypothetical protein
VASERDNDRLDAQTRHLRTFSRPEARQHARAHVRTTRPLLTTEPPPPTVTEPATDELCDVCGEPDGELDDVVANYWDPSTATAHLAHPVCAGGEEGWRLA